MSTAAVPRPRLPSTAEIEKSMRERMPGLVLYNPSDRWIQLEVFGLTHLWATPDLGGAVEMHPITHAPVVCNGRTEIKGRQLFVKDSSGKVIEGQDAASMLKFLTSPDRYGQMGMVWLPGAETAEDARYIEAGQAVWMDYQRKQDEDIVSKRAEFKANWEKAPHHKGEACPPPTSAESAAMDRLQRRKRKAEWKFNCPIAECPGYATQEWGKFQDHMLYAHNQQGLDRSKFESGIGNVGFDSASRGVKMAERALTGEDRVVGEDTLKQVVQEAAASVALGGIAAAAEVVEAADDEVADRPVRRGKR